VQKYLF